MRCTRLICALLMMMASTVTATELSVSVTSGLSGSIVVQPGATVDYQVRGVLSDTNNRGLALFLFDLASDTGPLDPADTPATSPMANFAWPLGITNPAGFGGTQSGGTLVQVGGVQNTIGNTADNAPFPTGTVALGIAHTVEDLVTGSLTAPMMEGVYTLSLSNLKAAVIREGATGNPFWATEPAAVGTITDLTITVSTTLMPSPQITAAGPRYVAVTAPPDAGEMALLLTGDPVNPDVSCVSTYVQADATLDSTPVFQDSNDWGTVYIKGIEILPATGYLAQADYGGGTLSPATSATTHRWGDPDGNGTISIFDVFCVLNAFSGQYDECSFYEVDMYGDGVEPDGAVNVFDLFVVLNSFGGEGYAGPLPCPGP